MSFGTRYPTDDALTDDALTGGVMARRCFAILIDAVVLGMILLVLGLAFFAFGLLTFGLGFGAMAILPLVPILYQVLSLVSVASATPGQRMMGLMVRRDADFGPPTAVQALISVLVLYLTMATSGLLLVVALFTTRHRTLHDILSGLVVVRLEALTAGRGRWNMEAGTFAP